MKKKESGLAMLYRGYHRADIRGLRFEATYLLFVLAIRLHQLAEKLIVSTRDELTEMVTERFGHDSTEGQ